MEIQSGKLYENRTWKYLYPSLRAYGEELIDKLSALLKVAVGVGDTNREDEEPSLYILVNTNIPLVSQAQRDFYKSNLMKFLDWIAYQDYYVDDYVFDKGMHMIVVKLHEKHHTSFMHFVKGEYSEMYNLAERRNYFRFLTLQNKQLELTLNNKLKITRSILEKDPLYLPTFVKEVNERFKTSVEEKYFKDAQLDYPPIKKEEIFNYR